MRTLLIRYMVEIFDPSTTRFKVQELVGDVSLHVVDVECILNLDNKGLSASDILIEEGEDIKDRVPPQSLSKSTRNIVIDDVIPYIIKNKSADDDFLRKVVLVLLGTVIAPMSSKLVPKKYYTLVDDVKRICKINGNVFTLHVLFDCVCIVKKHKHVRQWRKGNLDVLQEKVQPVEGDYAFNPNLSLQPLMRNWTEASTTRRDRFDYDNGCGCGNVKIKDNITQEYRVHEPRDLDHGTIQKPNPKPTSATARKSKPAFNPDDMMDVFMNMCIDYMNRQARQIPDQVAEKVLEKLNKEGVMYKPAAVVPSCKNDGHDEVDSFENAMFSENVAPEVVANELMPELIGVDVTFVEIAWRSEKNKGKRVYYNGNLNGLTSEMLRPVLERRWVLDAAHLALRVGHDRHLYPAWRSIYLVDQALARDNPLSSPYNMDSELSRSGADNRVKDEYTLRDKIGPTGLL
ncbi:hypothetical protein D1007_19389 [Hordeum vulgare]|nr:hypothetical protein D1007_19389 [Hordeum vulgare]